MSCLLFDKFNSLVINSKEVAAAVEHGNIDLFLISSFEYSFSIYGKQLHSIILFCCEWILDK